MNVIERAIREEEIVLLITKYLEENGYAKTLKEFKRENLVKKIDYGEIECLSGLKDIMNDYLRLRREEMARNSMSHSVSLSMGPYVEKMFKNFESMLADYKHYRDMIEDQVKKINAAFEKDTITETPGEAEANESQPQSSACDLPMEHYLHLYRTLPTILPDLINQKLNEG
ncbi:hypothetical protein WA577_007036, partial [Blastocystis sp. JDR]